MIKPDINSDIVCYKNRNSIKSDSCIWTDDSFLFLKIKANNLFSKIKFVDLIQKSMLNTNTNNDDNNNILLQWCGQFFIVLHIFVTWNRKKKHYSVSPFKCQIKKITKTSNLFNSRIK